MHDHKQKNYMSLIQVYVLEEQMRAMKFTVEAKSLINFND